MGMLKSLGLTGVAQDQLDSAKLDGLEDYDRVVSPIGRLNYLREGIVKPMRQAAAALRREQSGG